MSKTMTIFRMGGTGKKGLLTFLCLVLLLGVVLGDDNAPAEPAADEGGDKSGDDAGTDKDKDKPKGTCYYRQFGGEIMDTVPCQFPEDDHCVTYWDTEYGQEYRGCTSEKYALKQWGLKVSATCAEVTTQYKLVDRYACICKGALCNDSKFGHSQYKAFRGRPGAPQVAQIAEADDKKSGAPTLDTTLNLVKTFVAAVLAY